MASMLCAKFAEIFLVDYLLYIKPQKGDGDMTADEYLYSIIKKYAVNVSAAEAAANSLVPTINAWGGNLIVGKQFSGSLAKGTAVSLATDADIFVSLSSTTTNTLKEIYNTLYDALSGAGYSPRKQNVSIGVTVNGYKVDVVPGKRQSQQGNDHSLYKNRQNTWTKTNIDTHINLVQKSNRLNEIKVLKIWKKLHSLEFPSFFLEMAAMDALKGARGTLSQNVWTVLTFLRDNIETICYIDPANTNNTISDDCTKVEKTQISNSAKNSLAKKTWEEIVW